MAEVGFDLAGLAAAVAAEGRVARVVIAAHDGSSPREVGAAMLVWGTGASGTIGGGALEWEAIGRARLMLASGGLRLDREALGPKLGQCCGGAVTLLTEVYGAAEVAGLEGDVIARPVAGAAMPLAVKRMLDRARAQGDLPQAVLVQGWMVEPVARTERQIWVWGAGHVGRALVGVLQPLPGLAITWVDVARERFPDALPEGVTALWAAAAERLADHAPQDAEHLVLTYSHALDLELCHRLLLRGFGGLGLIGSATKWARFRARLRALGHGDAAIMRIRCPIGDTSLGKHPQAIALGVALDVLKHKNKNQTETEIAV
ncbi:xanthine dehydrogenase accessory protein XdhC [Fertoebacter nigrum]|uniref:Xanthine dehydrogenase accessory protein XdhC n=1 Tax=Fertoeibacter niger TaxID=2656921 RepID=A0A8X8H0C1_9RHOB|nr:xanthine dehydrogenase accessory protein XdhC [Fertoeibacter niger]NUB44620.1 xanthine dehydrogenase accessory protein XdhC [Fertoeibacter niger]